MNGDILIDSLLFAVAREQFYRVAIIAVPAVVFLIALVLTWKQASSTGKKSVWDLQDRSSGKLRVSDRCPNCGSKESTPADPGKTVGIFTDRVCKSCGTQYTAPIPRSSKVELLVAGIGMTAVGALLLYLSLLHHEEAHRSPMLRVFGGLMVVGGIVAAGAAVRMMFLREKRPD